ncbi:hypothetical protein EJ04DRAFT_554701 [Polyplosphaeria fusca]|uniref:C2H2-type domain-containing protein n=1 Tax=Polyplosphaeria fusca TaxID=682080 RepID=A0A9P4UZY0_9PLEO|nr:hypothetical protein EJ04DRAFT_554701 [Polyplosphaeria fusca]
MSTKVIGQRGRRTRFKGVGSRPTAPAVKMGKGRASLSITAPTTSQAAFDKDMDSDPSSYSDSYSDPDTDLDALSDAETEPDVGIVPSISGHEFCSKIQKQTRKSPEDLLRRCESYTFKSYLYWRKTVSRIKKESAIDAYWNRIGMYYHHVTGFAMRIEVLRDVRNWIPSLELDRSKKEKLAMYVQTLYAIIHALWVYDTKPLPGFVRIQISLLLLLSVATGTRPGAVVESASNKGSNKALCFKDVELMKVRSISDPNKSTIVVNVNLEHVKNKSKDGTPKKFTFRLEGLPALCIVLHFLGIGEGRSAFRNDFKIVQQIFDLVIPAERNMLRIRWKQELLDKPFFCDFDHTPDGGRMREVRAFPYAKYRDVFIRLGLVLGIEERLELYQLRRASGHNINSAVTTAERNQTMDQSGDTYERYYTPTHIARDFQAIYFGTPSQDELVRSVASMGLSRDRRAPTELNDVQQKEVRNDPLLAALREEREGYKRELNNRRFYPLSKARGTEIHEKYEKTKKDLARTYQQLQRLQLRQIIRKFHDSIDTDEIARQLSGKAPEEVLILPTVEFEHRERATIAAMLFKPIKTDRTRVRFVQTLVRLFPLRETRRPKATKRAAAEFVFESYGAAAPSRWKKTRDGSQKPTATHDGKGFKQEPNLSECGDVVEIGHRHPYPNVPPHPVCGFCYGNKLFTHKQRTKHWERKDVRKNHVKTHLREVEYQGGFECAYPNCRSMLDGGMHFLRHSLDVHKVAH